LIPLGPRRAALLAGLIAVALLAPAGGARAGSYTVLACEAASAEHGFSGDSFFPWGNAGIAYKACPTNGNKLNGISNRIVDQTVGAGAFSTHTFDSPPNTTITAVKWSGRFARDNCNWSTIFVAHPSGAVLTGLPAHSFCATTGGDFWNTTFAWQPPPGTSTVGQVVQCKAATSCAPGATFHTRYAEVTVQDDQPPSFEEVSGELASGQWVRGDQPVHVRVADNAGIDSLRAEIPGIPAPVNQYPCSSVNARRCPFTPVTADPVLHSSDLPDGTHTLRITAVDSGRNPAALTYTVHVDNTPPEAVRTVVVGGESWRRENRFDVDWASAPQAYAPITSVHWELCEPGGPCHQGTSGPVSSLNGLSVPKPGDYLLRVWLEDAAGNTEAPPKFEAVHLRHDPVAPSLAFDPQDPLDPLRVAVSVHDEHSGLAGGEIEMRRVGSETWHALDTSVGESKLIANVDDERFRKGSYQFRARAVDQAGNEASTDRLADGRMASLRLPVRIATRLRAGFPRRVIRRRIVRHNGRRRVVRRRITTLRSSARVEFGKRVTIRGRITNLDGQPIDEATINVLELVEGRRGFAPIGISHADKLGAFSYVARALRTRILRFRYPGAHRILPAVQEVRLGVPAISTIRVNRSAVLNGDQVLFSGRIRTRPVPREGKLVEVQAFFRGRWRTISTVRSDGRGRWRFPYRFGGTFGRVRYRFRVRLPHEGGYPFDDGASPATSLTVRGP
jgi:hypothetical protein